MYLTLVRQVYITLINVDKCTLKSTLPTQNVKKTVVYKKITKINDFTADYLNECGANVPVCHQHLPKRQAGKRKRSFRKLSLMQASRMLQQLLITLWPNRNTNTDRQTDKALCTSTECTHNHAQQTWQMPANLT